MALFKALRRICRCEYAAPTTVNVALSTGSKGHSTEELPFSGLNVNFKLRQMTEVDASRSSFNWLHGLLLR